jgi:hypothetical protein
MPNDTPRASMKESPDKRTTILSRQSSTPRETTLQKADEKSQASPYEEWSKNDLYERAIEEGIEGRARMSRKDLINSLRDY